MDSFFSLSMLTKRFCNYDGTPCVSALFWLLGACPPASLICQRQLSFIHSFSVMSADALSRCVLVLCLATGSVLYVWSQFLSCHSLPNTSVLFCSSTSVYGWRRFIRSHLVAESHTTVLVEYSHLPVGCWSAYSLLGDSLLLLLGTCSFVFSC